MKKIEVDAMDPVGCGLCIYCGVVDDDGSSKFQNVSLEALLSSYQERIEILEMLVTTPEVTVRNFQDG